MNIPFLTIQKHFAGSNTQGASFNAPETVVEIEGGEVIGFDQLIAETDVTAHEETSEETPEVIQIPIEGEIEEGVIRLSGVTLSGPFKPQENISGQIEIMRNAPVEAGDAGLSLNIGDADNAPAGQIRAKVEHLISSPVMPELDSIETVAPKVLIEDGKMQQDVDIQRAELNAPVRMPSDSVNGLRQAVASQPQITQQSVARQIAHYALQVSNGQVSLEFSPENLGRVSIKLVPVEAAMNVVLAVERAEAETFLKRNLIELEREFEALGYTDVSFEFQQDQNTSGSENAFSNDQPVVSRDQDPTEDAGPAKIYLMRSGLDLRL